MLFIFPLFFKVVSKPLESLNTIEKSPKTKKELYDTFFQNTSSVEMKPKTISKEIAENLIEVIIFIIIK